MDQVQDLYMDDELDSEWAQYVASLNTVNSPNSRRNREKRKIERRERESMTNLQKHVRGLSRARFELTADAAIQLFDGESTSDSDSASETGTVNILSTPISRRDKLLELDFDHLDTDSLTHSESDSEHADSIDLASSDSDSDAVPPTPTETPQSTAKSHRALSAAMAPISISEKQKEKEVDDPYNVRAERNRLSVHDLNESNDSETETELELEREVNDSHSMFSPNISAHCECAPSESDDADEDSKSFKLSCSRSVSTCTSTTKSPRPNLSETEAENEHLEMDIDVAYDAELEALKKELSLFQRKNRKHSRMRRTKSREEVLLSMLKIDCAAMDGDSLSECTSSALTKYNSAQWRTPSPATMTPIPELHPERYLLDSGHLSPVPVQTQGKGKGKKEKADPYGEEWNGLDPDDYVWCDAVPEGECFDDAELSLYDRRVQYLVVTAIDNGYCDIEELTYSQNELLIMHQQSLVW